MGVDPSPRPGDPFANHISQPQQPAKKVKRKKGRTFFIVLLLIGGALMIATFILATQGKEIMVDFYKDVVIARGIPEALPPGYPVDKARALLRALDDFMDQVGTPAVTDDAALELMAQIEAAMADRVVIDEEVDALLGATEALRTGAEGQ